MSSMLTIYNESWIRASLGAAGKSRGAKPQNFTHDIARLLENLSALSADSRGGLVSALQGNGNLTEVTAQAGTGNPADLMAKTRQMYEQAEQMARTAKTPEEVMKAQQALADAQKMFEMMSRMLQSQHDAGRAIIQQIGR